MEAASLHPARARVRPPCVGLLCNPKVTLYTCQDVPPTDASSSRPPLTKERVLRAAVELADRRGIGALTMRRLGSALGVEAMSLYKHVANKEAILAGMVDMVVGEIAIPDEGEDWRTAMWRRAASAREVLGRHSWVIGLMEADTAPGPNTLRYMNAIIGNLRAAGFAMEHATRAFMVLDSYVYGHVVQESNLPFGTLDEMVDEVRSALDHVAMIEFPHLVDMYQHALTFEYSLDDQFAYGLELVLDGIERQREG